ncbi:uncharacterized protein VTP21DRAFT_5448 [Calcarisporiella thermophila]|uniref:uncharacterized protein n=1 Tax=Calcarisporiella thermophila TaxID=911321 RepID=UPI003744A66D
MAKNTYLSASKAATNAAAYSFETKCLQVSPASFIFESPKNLLPTNNSLSEYAETDLDVLSNINDPQLQINDPAAEAAIEEAVSLLQNGEVVALPTETVYGLAANALSEAAVRKIYAAKNRPADNPLIVHVSSLRMLRDLLPGGRIPREYNAAIRQFWPGPLTIILPVSALIPEVVTCGQPTVAVRFPAHPVARAVIQRCQFPLAAPSANASGRPSPTLASHVLRDLSGRLPLVLDGGQCSQGIESTVLDALRHPPAILRPGGVTFEQLCILKGLDGLQVYRRDFVDKQLEAAPTTPGMKYRHYSPDAEVVLFEHRYPTQTKHGNANDLCLNHMDSIRSEISRLQAEGKERIGVLRVRSGDSDPTNGYPRSGDISDSKQVIERWLGDAEHPETVARELFRQLRALDEEDNVNCILVEGIPEKHAGLAVMNRLRKAASRVIYYE